MSGTELARRSGVSGPAVSQLLSALDDVGLLQRELGTEDRRRLTLSLSRAGKRALTRADALLTEQLGALLEDLPRPEADALARALPRVEAELSGAHPPRRPAHPPPPPKRRPNRRA